jgi:sugar phosphate isomerase/epimerase
VDNVLKSNKVIIAEQAKIYMIISASDWGDLDLTLPVVWNYKIGLELQQLAYPENLDRAAEIAPELRSKLSGIPCIGMHGPFFDLIPASRDPLARKVTLQRFQQAYEAAKLIGASHLVLHSGFFPKTYPRDVWIQNSYDFWVNFLSDKPTISMIHVENVYENDFAPLQELIERVSETLGDDRMTVCLDIGHVNANSSRSMTDWISGLGDWIRYVHLHNNDGILDDHWRLDRGKIDISRVLELLQKHSPKAIWTVETYPEDLEPSLEWLKGRGFL